MELGADGTSNRQSSRISCGSNGAVTYYLNKVGLDYVELSSAGSMIMLVASGTAVVIEE